MKKFDKSLRKDVMYKKGVKDSLKFLYSNITGIDHATGFSASHFAQTYSNTLKDLYNKMHMTLLGTK